MTPANRLQRYPTVRDLEGRARRRLPLIAWEYLDMGTGDEKGVGRNRVGLDRITMLPRICKGLQTQDLSTTLLGQTFAAPFGCAVSAAKTLLDISYETALEKFVQIDNSSIIFPDSDNFQNVSHLLKKFETLEKKN